MKGVCVTAGKSVGVAVGKQAFAVSVRNDSNHTQQKTDFSNGQKEKQTTENRNIPHDLPLDG